MSAVWTLVVDPDVMDDETLFKHMNARHMPVGTLSRIRWHKGCKTGKAWRAYHRRVHATNPDLDHGHSG